MKFIKLKAEHNRLESLLKDYKGEQDCTKDLNDLRELKKILKQTNWLIKYSENENKIREYIAYGDAQAQAFKSLIKAKGWKLYSVSVKPIN